MAKTKKSKPSKRMTEVEYLKWQLLRRQRCLFKALPLLLIATR